MPTIKTQDRSAMPSELLDIQQLADRLKVSVGCIRAWRLRGEGPPAIKLGSVLRWDSQEVIEWINSRRESELHAG
ncbi:helix-turn-helix transcriptional regulator [Mycobacterium intracellulare]|uniref:helix-turn-helix transcriptional regulator n=1 Tax=Mycobacterium intracellulare TaxID=1767 RepID=UPI003556F881